MEFDVLLSEFPKGKSVILTVSAVELKNLLSKEMGKANAVMPFGQGWIVAEVKEKNLNVKMTSENKKTNNLPQQGTS